ncbi:hypothetical protein [uncultured Methanobrevibacter sp.]|uniref:beta strand repeat-containing protein n=1 Tax=uncultured Methanobrevibacter sp. TaxID=253161 RepID=UPI002603215D|nr:hypothetical protein [uncultured Methanobrevibacter sp.]
MKVPDTQTMKNGNLNIPITPTGSGISLKASYETASYTKSIGDFELLQNIISKAQENTTINLNRSYTYTQGLDTITEGIIIDKPLTINGNGFTINAQQSTRIFKITSDNVTIKNLTLINGKTQGKGGAIYWASNNAHILNCSFENNIATYNGGANYFDKALANSTINGNYNHNKAHDNGGANYFWSTLTNTTINGTYNNNTATYGGANHFQNTLTNTTINGTYNNNDALNGGANHFEKALANSTINGNYNNNTAQRGGANNFNEKLTNTTITGNYNHNKADIGGANTFRNTLTNTTITGIYINNRGSNTVYIVESNQNSLIKDSIFINNTGNIYVGNGNIQVTNCWFGNTASNYDTDITNSWRITADNWYFLDITLNDTDATVSLNNLYKNKQTSKDDNCKLPDINMTLTGKNIKVPDTQTMKNGNLNIPITPEDEKISLKASYETASYTKGTGDFDILQSIINNAQKNSTINLNRSHTYTQGFDTITEGIIIDKPLTINGNGHTINANQSTRIFKITSDNTTIKNLILANGNTTGNGGAIYWESSNAYILNCSFENNTATIEGGANHFYNTLTNSTITGTYNNNTATRGGANHFVYALTNTTITGTYNHNTATLEGGANHFTNTLTNSTITGTYNHNTATIEGGANAFYGTLTNTTINGTYNNNYALNGGANHFIQTLNTTITGTYNNNTASIGGANHFYGTLTNTTINGNYTSNKARYGGANTFRNTLTNTTITGIYINNRGPNTVYIEKSDQSNIIKDSIFMNNAYNIEIENGNIQVTDCWFGNNASNYNTDMTNSQGITTDNWYFLDITLNDTDATVSLNNLYKNGNVIKDDNCKLPDINMTLTATNIKVPDTQTMKNGNLNIPITPTGSGITLKAIYETASYTKSVGDFELLQSIISSTQENTTVKLNRSYTYTQGLDTITEGILIDKALTINGNGHTINANQSTRIFKITSDNVTIKNIILANGKA